MANGILKFLFQMQTSAKHKLSEVIEMGIAPPYQQNSIQGWCLEYCSVGTWASSQRKVESRAALRYRQALQGNAA